MDQQEESFSLVSELRLEKILEEADQELNKIQPHIEYLEESLKKLSELKQKKHKLLALKASIKSLLNQNDVNNDFFQNQMSHINNDTNKLVTSGTTSAHVIDINNTYESNLFVPELALTQVKQFLRTKNNLNYEIFKAVVYNGGEATTEEIKRYLVSNKITQPKTGKTFDDVELKDISSRANYLVRKQVLVTVAPGVFKTILGYSSENND
jgi:DNA repair exonuclease SbcCD ATPase subunit